MYSLNLFNQGSDNFHVNHLISLIKVQTVKVESKFRQYVFGDGGLYEKVGQEMHFFFFLWLGRLLVVEQEEDIIIEINNIRIIDLYLIGLFFFIFFSFLFFCACVFLDYF